MASGGDSRLKSYKTRGLNVEEVRRKRGEEGIQLRKSKREDQLSKRRNLSPALGYVEESEADTVFPEGTPVDVLAKALYTSDTKLQLAATSKFRKILSVFGNNPPISEVIETGCIPKFIELLSHSDPQLQFEAAWVLTNIASGSSLQTRTVLEGVPPLIQLLQSPHEFVKEQAVWALGNVAGDSPECRDVVLGYGIMDPLLELLHDPTLNLPTRRNATWTLSNLCRGKNPAPETDVIMRCLPVLSFLLQSDDADILSNCCWSVAFLGDGPNHKIQRIVDAGLCRRLVELLMHPSKTVIAPALRAVGNILTGDDVQTQVVINCSVLPALQHLLSCPYDNLQKESCWCISNITAGNRVQIQGVIECNIFPALVDIITSAVDYKTRKEAVWAVLNATSGGTHQQIRYLVSISCIKPLCDMLTVQDPKIVLVTLEGLENILKVGQQDMGRNGGVNPFSVLIEEAYGLDKIESLQNHSSEQIYHLAYRIIEKYFSCDDEVDSTVEPQKAEDGGNFLFNSNSNPPEGGFQF